MPCVPMAAHSSTARANRKSPSKAVAAWFDRAQPSRVPPLRKQSARTLELHLREPSHVGTTSKLGPTSNPLQSSSAHFETHLCLRGSSKVSLFVIK
jgi:hypothetical protein